MIDKLTQKQETFVQNLFSGMSQYDAYREAGYAVATQTRDTVNANASRLANNVNILVRLDELNQKAEDASIATVVERKQRLTEIVRADIPDYIQEEGIKVEKKSPNVGAVSEITTRTKAYRKGSEPVVITNLKLHNPIHAISELNKMERIYEAEGTITIDNRTLNITVNSEKAKELTKRLLEGERTK